MALFPADWVTLTRIPCAAAFVLTVDHPWRATVVLAIAGATDVLDGWLARRRGEAHELGALLDGVVDKIFVLTVVVSLVVQRRLPLLEAALLGVRDVGELLVIAVALLLPMRAVRLIGAERLGKATTMVQFAVVIAALHGLSARPLLAATAGVLGLATTLAHARRSLVDPGRRAAMLVEAGGAREVYRAAPKPPSAQASEPPRDEGDKGPSGR